MTAEHKKIGKTDRLMEKVEAGFEEMLKASPAAAVARPGEPLYMAMKGSYYAGYLAAMQEVTPMLEEVNGALTDLNKKITESQKK